VFGYLPVGLEDIVASLNPEQAYLVAREKKPYRSFELSTLSGKSNHIQSFFEAGPAKTNRSVTPRFSRENVASQYCDESEHFRDDQRLDSSQDTGWLRDDFFATSASDGNLEKFLY